MTLPTLRIDENLDFPRYSRALDFAQLERDYPPPPEFFKTVYRMPRDKLDALKERRFLALVKDYLGSVCAESAKIPAAVAAFDTLLDDLRTLFAGLTKVASQCKELAIDQKHALMDAASELADSAKSYAADRAKLLARADGFTNQYSKVLSKANDKQHTARVAFEPIAEAMRGLIKQVDLLYKLAARVADIGGELAVDETISAIYDRRATSKLMKQVDEARKAAVEQLKHAVYFHRQVAWLQDRFPKAELQAVPGLAKLVDRKDIEAADWSLTPGPYVGVAPPEEDDEFDFEQTIRDIHTELTDLNTEAVTLAAKIQENFAELGA